MSVLGEGKRFEGLARPQLVEAKLLRLSGHGEHDDANYVPKENGRVITDGLPHVGAQMLEHQWASEQEIMVKSEADEVQLAVALLKKTQA